MIDSKDVSKIEGALDDIHNMLNDIHKQEALLFAEMIKDLKEIHEIVNEARGRWDADK